MSSLDPLHEKRVNCQGCNESKQMSPSIDKTTDFALTLDTHV